MNAYFSREFIKNYKKLKEDRRKLIDKAIDEIINNPECGKPLQYALKGLRSYRIENMRVIYRIEKDGIYFVTFGLRRNIYELLKKKY